MPPWLWLWAVVFALRLPPSWAHLWEASAGFVRTQESFTRVMRRYDEAYGQFEALRYPGLLLDWLPSVALALGLASALLPRLRAARVERVHGLKPAPPLPVLREIEAFVRSHHPRVELRANVLRGGTAIAYPAGWRRARVAVFGGLCKLWRADRAAAEAVLLHEVAHCRRGDFVVVGAGSPLRALLRWGALAYAALFLLPVAALAAVDIAHALARTETPGALASRLALRFVRLDAPSHLAIALGAALHLASALILPVLAIWLAELDADRYAAERQAGGEGVRRGLSHLRAGRSLSERVTALLSHPPSALRELLLRHPGARAASLALFPLASGARIGLLLLRAALIRVSLGEPVERVWAGTVTNARTALGTFAPDWTAMAVILLAWPLVARAWDHAFAGDGGTARRPPSAGYVVSAGLAAALAAWGWSQSWQFSR